MVGLPPLLAFGLDTTHDRVSPPRLCPLFLRPLLLLASFPPLSCVLLRGTRSCEFGCTVVFHQWLVQVIFGGWAIGWDWL